MSAFCCLKPSPSIDGMDPAKPANRKGIQKTGADLLAGQQTGMAGRYDEYGAFGLGMDDPFYCKFNFSCTKEINISINLIRQY